MKRLLFLVILLLSKLLLYCQVNREENEALHVILEQDTGKNNVYYKEYINEHIVSSVVRQLIHGQNLYFVSQNDSTNQKVPFDLVKVKKILL